MSSYATSIGSSADRPAALAELMGILSNNGVRKPSSILPELRFAKDTPYETLLSEKATASEQVLSPEIVQVVRAAITEVAEHGTAQRIKPKKRS